MVANKSLTILEVIVRVFQVTLWNRWFLLTESSNVLKHGLWEFHFVFALYRKITYLLGKSTIPLHAVFEGVPPEAVLIFILHLVPNFRDVFGLTLVKKELNFKNQQS